MRSLRTLSALFIFCLLLPTSPLAQPQDGTTVGLGVSINSISITGVGAQTGAGTQGEGSTSLTPVSFSAPITTPSFRIEPEIGFFRFNQSGKASSQSTVTSRSTSTLTVGAGLFYLHRFDAAQVLIGGRVGLNRRSTDISFDADFQDDRNSTATDFSIGPAVGGEYYFSNHFSIGVEARFVYVNVGAPDEAEDDFSASRLRTSGAAALRFHF